MPVFVTSQQSTNRHGVFAIERTPPAAITPTGTGQAVIVEQFPWGPSQTLTTPTSLKNMYNLICPAGFGKTPSTAGGEGYQAVIRKAWPNNVLKFVRVLGTSGAVAATVTLVATGPINVCTVTAAWPGANGNSLTATVSAASDGNANHFKLTVTITGASGTTSDIVDNINFSGVGTNSSFNSGNIGPTANPPTLLIGSIAFLANGVPTAGTFNFTTGADGTINAGAYVGTQGNADFGIAQCEKDVSIRHCFSGDPGNTLRPSVNAGWQAHTAYMTDRIAYINGNSGQTPAQVLTDVASYRSTRVVYTDPWVYILDDVTGAKTLVPSAPFATSVSAQVSPSTPIAWKNIEIQQLLGGINDLETDRGSAAGTNSQNGIVTVIREINGGFTFECQNVTNTPNDFTRKNLSRMRIGDYIAISFVNSIRGFVDAPNVPYNQSIIIQALDMFMASLKKSANVDPNHRPHVLDYQIGNLSAVNSLSDIAAGTFTIPLDVQTSAGMEQIFLSIRYGENVQVVHQS